MPGMPVVISDTHGLPVRPVSANGVPMMIATNGFGTPIVISDLGIPAVIEGYFSPLDLGADLLAWWDASQGVALNGAKVSAWTDRKNGLVAAQATDAARPTLGASAFNNVPGITFDGADDFLTITPVPASIPVGAVGSWIYAVLSQDALAADATNRYIASYGAGTNDSRHFRRTVSGSNRLNAITGTGAGIVSITEATVDFSGRKLAIAKFDPTTVAAAVDASADTSSAAVPATASTLFNIGASPGGTLFGQMVLRDLIVTKPLSAPNEAALETYLLARRRI